MGHLILLLTCNAFVVNIFKSYVYECYGNTLKVMKFLYLSI